MKRLLFLAFLFATPSLAQQQPDPVVMQRAIAALQAQRNQSMDIALSSDMRAAGLADELAKAHAKIKELQDKLPNKGD